MTDGGRRQAYLDELVRKRGYVLDYHKALAKQDFEALKAIDGLIETVYLKDRHLDRKTKELLFVHGLTIQRASRGHIKSHIQAALSAGANEGEILESIELALPEAGVVAFQHGFDAWCEITGARGIEPGVKAYDGGSETDR